MIGKRLGDYEILREIGEGGQGDIYLAKNIHLPGVLVVLKILKSRGQKDRFLREATTLAKLEHKNICQMKHFFTHENSLILVVQYIDGQTLKDFITTNKGTDLRPIQRIFIQVLDALIYAHSHGVTHRDIKPSNIMIDKNGVVKIIDFGIARDIADPRLTVTGTSAGTPQYMAPEQFTEDKITDFTRCDIYSTGISLYEACCGVLPFADTNPYVLKEKHCGEDPVAPSKYNRQVSHSLEKVILTAMRKQPGKRYSTAEAMRHILMQASVGDATETKVVVSGRGRAKVAMWAVIVTAVLAITLLGYQYRPQIESLFRNPPKLRIASQTIDEGAAFSPIWLDSLVAVDSALAGASWTFHGFNDLSVETGLRAFRIIQPSQDWYGSETIIFVVSRSNGEIDTASAIYEVLNVNDHPVIDGVIGQRVNEGEDFTPIPLGDLVDDIDDPDSSIVWTWAPTEHLEISRDSLGNLIVTSQAGWSGEESVLLIAADRSGASDTLIGEFEVRPRWSEIELIDTVIAGKKIESKPIQHEVRLRVEPKGSIIRDNLGKTYEDSLSLLLAEGDYTYTVYSKDYPLQEVGVNVNSQAVDTTIDLNEIYASAEHAILGVAVWKAGEVVAREVILNRIKTGKISTDWLFSLVAGKYEVGVELKAGLTVDSLVFDGRTLTPNTRYFMLQSGVRNVVWYYVSAKD